MLFHHQKSADDKPTTVPETAHKIEYNEWGPADVLKYVKSPVPEPGPGQILVKNHAIGLNFIEIYFRSGLYKAAKFPHAGLGGEGAGIVVKVGPDVENFKVGDRVSYCSAAGGSYAEYTLALVPTTFRLPDAISYEVAASVMVKGLTVQYLFRQTYKLKEGDTILFHAAAGGVGLIAMQWARILGVKAIATASTDEKCKLAKKYGAWETINYKKEDVVERVRELTNGKKVPVVYDSVGKDTWEVSLDSCAPLGLIVSFGNASGPVTGIDVGILNQKGSLFLTRPSLFAFTDKLHEMADELFGYLESGQIVSEINQRYRLEDAAAAHEELAGRKTTGASVLLPEEFATLSYD